MGRAHGIATGSGAAPRIELPRCHITTKNHNPHASHPSLCSLARKMTRLAQPGDETVEFSHPRWEPSDSRLRPTLESPMYGCVRLTMAGYDTDPRTDPPHARPRSPPHGRTTARMTQPARRRWPRVLAATLSGAIVAVTLAGVGVNAMMGRLQGNITAVDVSEQLGGAPGEGDLRSRSTRRAATSPSPSCSWAATAAAARTTADTGAPRSSAAPARIPRSCDGRCPACWLRCHDREC